MTAVGLSVAFTDMWRIGWRPLAAGFAVATLVGGCSLLLNLGMYHWLAALQIRPRAHPRAARYTRLSRIRQRPFRPRRVAGRMSMASTRSKVSRRAAEGAVRTLLRWAGEDPRREGLHDTPQRVVDAYRDWFSGYEIDPAAYLRRTFEEVGGYDEMVVLRDIAFESHCEHHMAPIIGRVHIGYLPADKVVGISKLARVVDGYARRFQVQEKLTAQIADCITEVLKPRGVGVVVSTPSTSA